jgi:iron complex outermembrane recepter protein
LRRFINDGSRGPNQTLNPDGSLSKFTAANNYNFGAVNYFQRPDERWTAGAFAHYEFNDHADAYSEFMFMRDNTTSQIAPSGAFYSGYPFSKSGGLTVNCSNPFLNANELNQWCGGSTAGDATLLRVALARIRLRTLTGAWSLAPAAKLPTAGNTTPTPNRARFS